jgi:hypothetical protein
MSDDVPHDHFIRMDSTDRETESQDASIAASSIQLKKAVEDLGKTVEDV